MSLPNELENQKKIEIALKKAKGAIDKAYELIKLGDTQCSEVLVQIDSAIGSLNSSREKVLSHYLDLCLAENLEKGDISKIKNQLARLYKLQK